MSDKIIQKKDLPDIVKSLKETYEVFAPVKENGFYSFKRLKDEEDID
jgi:hypothetical protein